MSKKSLSVPSEKVHVRVFHQIDPGGAVTGGIDTVIKGIAKWAPDDIEISMVGLTMDNSVRPVGRWSVVQIGERTVRFFPVGRHNTPMHRSRIPLSLRLTAGILRHWSSVSKDCDVLEFHRIEPALPFLLDGRSKNAFVHQNMDSLYNPNADIGWKHLPQAFFALESLVMPYLQSIFGVREDAVTAYKARYPKIADRFRFIPTWMDPQIFRPAGAQVRSSLRQQLCVEYGFQGKVELVVSVGRLDQQKNPILALESIERLLVQRPNVKLIWIGDGVLRADVERAIKDMSLENAVVLAGLATPQRISQILQASDVYLMTSAYEGMPISVLEALGCGLPVVSTNVGEVPRVVKNDLSGIVLDSQDHDALADGLAKVLARGQSSYEAGCLLAVAPYVPERVLGPLFGQYRAARAST